MLQVSLQTQKATPGPANTNAPTLDVLSVCSYGSAEAIDLSSVRRYRLMKVNQSISMTTIVNKHGVCG